MFSSLRILRSTILSLVLLVLLDVALASPQHESELLATTLQARDTTESGALNCETARSSDYYGLGVRIGVYFAWFQAWIANVCVPDEIPAALDTNAVFLFATFMSMLKCTLTGILLQMDGLMLMHISGGTMFSVLSLWGYRTCTYDLEGPRKGIRQFGGNGTHLRLLLCMAVSTYGLFYWNWGLKGHLNWNTDPGCGVVYTFMFAKVRIDGGIRTFYIIICSLCMIYYGTMLLASLIALPERLKRFARFHKKGDDGKRTKHKFATGLNVQQLRYIFYFLRIGNFLFIIYSILLIEFSLNYNHVAGVLGWEGHIFFPSQIIPLILGAFGFCRVIWVRYKKWKNDTHGYEAPRHVIASASSRTLFRPKQSKILEIYTPKSDVDKQEARNIDPRDMDPLMAGQPIWLRLLVTWLPWLGVLRWWNPDHDDYQGLDDRRCSNSEKDPEAYSVASGGWSSESTPRNPHMNFRDHLDTWRSDETAVSRTDWPRIPRKPLHAGTV